MTEERSLTIHEAAATTGWSARMLRYIEEAGLVVPRRSPSGYRLFGPEELQRLRTLRELLDEHGVGLAEVGFAARLRDDGSLRAALDGWFAAEATRPAEVSPSDWLAYEQDKHLQLLALAGALGAGDPEANGSPAATSPDPDADADADRDRATETATATAPA